LSGSSLQPIPYPDVNAALNALRTGVHAVLGENLVGLYVHGSLANGGFEPRRSDIDFIAATNGELPPQTIEALAAMHAALATTPHLTPEARDWVRKMEGSYIPRAHLRRYDPAHARHPALRVDGSFGVDFHASDWVIQRYVLRERGIALYGPDPRTLIDPIAPADLRRAARGILEEWWAPMLDDLYRLPEAEYQAYAVLTMCRSLYTLERADVASKAAAAHWAQAQLGPPLAGLIEQALQWGHGDPFDRLPDVMTFIRYTLERARGLA
jgi:hypothetical protein